METDDGWRVGFVDPRRFGSVDLVRDGGRGRAPAAGRARAGAAGRRVHGGGAVGRAGRASGRRSRRRCWTSAPSPGLGNIYVCEALFRAGISPLRLAHTVPGARAARLVPAIKATLTEAIAAGGSTLRDYVQPDGELGYFQHAWKVYGREGEPCERCPGPPACAGDAADRAVRPQHVLLPAHAALARTPPHSERAGRDDAPMADTR